jgi:hypothetical protein
MSWLIVGIGPCLYLRKTFLSPNDVAIAHDNKRWRTRLMKVRSASKPEDHCRQGLVVVTLNVQNVVFRQRLGARSTYCLPLKTGRNILARPYPVNPLKQENYAIFAAAKLPRSRHIFALSHGHDPFRTADPDLEREIYR